MSIHLVRICSWCGHPVGRHQCTLYRNGEKKVFHNGMMTNCLNEYLKLERLTQKVKATRRTC